MMRATAAPPVPPLRPIPPPATISTIGISPRPTSYYLFNGQRVAMEQADVLFYLFADHLGSASVSYRADDSSIIGQRYEPWGEVKGYHSNQLPTDYTYTGQEDVGFTRAPSNDPMRILDYGARYYWPEFGRFISPDTIVPEPGNPQSLNRYSYVLNNPLRYTDPTGYAPQKPGDPDPNNAPCSTQWCWQNRWHRARGYVWNGGGWSLGNSMLDIIFYDADILYETVGEAGVTFAGGWDWNTQKAQMTAIGQGIVKFGQKLSTGLAQLQNLLGGGAALHHVSNTPWYCFGAPACALPPGTNSVYFSTDFLTNNTPAWISMTTVHELAHVVDWHSRIGLGLAQNKRGNFSMAWHGAPITDYARRNAWERWAEAVTVWVFGDAYKKSERPLNVDIGAQMNRIEALLKEWW